ncbi:hypothetical protein NCG89_13600 [Spongiibacter taiwanensis]|uniref:hypothetical protein n=1 Tax=Spongiibacter taiwanensis TaxID=1748242 RepID=UPI002035256B|nr:hypothetical protein [Spongiibacter taiwanensis]USA42563.1 hypothetical protein NCG89_13600 [Spongiibacter taiwanensis]
MAAKSDYTWQKAALICTYAFVALTVIGWLGIANFISPAPADLTLEETKQWFSDSYRWQTILGCTLLYIGSALLTPGSIQWGLMLAKIEGRSPILSITTAVCGIFISLIVFLNACAWIVCSYRAQTDPHVIQAFSDWAWFAFLFGWVYLAIEMISSAIVELKDKREQPLVPHWMAWITLFSASTMLGAIGPAFFKSGPFAYHGLIAFYVPVLVWGAYLVVTNTFLYRALLREERENMQPIIKENADLDERYLASQTIAKQAG